MIFRHLLFNLLSQFSSWSENKTSRPNTFPTRGWLSNNVQQCWQKEGQGFSCKEESDHSWIIKNNFYKSSMAKIFSHSHVFLHIPNLIQTCSSPISVVKLSTASAPITSTDISDTLSGTLLKLVKIIFMMAWSSHFSQHIHNTFSTYIQLLHFKSSALLRWCFLILPMQIPLLPQVDKSYNINEDNENPGWCKSCFNCACLDII